MVSSCHTVNVNYYNYNRSNFFTGIDTEKVLQAGYTGLNTRNGSLLTLEMKDTGAVEPSKVFITMVADVIVNIKDNGCGIFD